MTNTDTTATRNRAPMYLSGAINAALRDREGFGWMRTPNMHNTNVGTNMWAADSGLYSPKGERAFELDAYLGWLRAQDPLSCLFATAPDRVGNAPGTIARSMLVYREIHRAGYNVAFVAQDGLEDGWSIPWRAFDVLFLGGSTEWKLGPAAAAVTREAKRRGKWVHMGRVNSFRRYAYAASIGCDSTDGTFLAFGPTVNLPRLLSWRRHYEAGLTEAPTRRDAEAEADLELTLDRMTWFRRRELEREAEDQAAAELARAAA